MRNRGRSGFVHCLLQLLLLFSCCCCCLLPRSASALITDFTLSHDARAAFHIASFGFEKDGVFHLELRDMELRLPTAAAAQSRESYDVAFVLGWSDNDAPVRLAQGESETTSGGTGAFLAEVPPPPGSDPSAKPTTTPLLDHCFHRSIPEGVGSSDSPAIILLLDKKGRGWDHLVYERVVEKEGFWHLYYSNCEPKSSVDVKVRLEEYNLNSDGSRCYLSAGERFLPALLAVLACFFTISAVVWLVVLRTHRMHVRRIHYLMALVICLKAFSLMVESERFHVLKASGVHNGWFGVSYLVQGVRTTLLFGVIVLLGSTLR